MSADRTLGAIRGRRRRYAPITLPFALVYLKHDDIALTLLGVGAVLIAAQVAGELFRRLHQPPVIGEVLAGILLGPTVLGHFSTTLFPLDARPILKTLATVGVVTFMFIAGVETDLRLVTGQRRRTVVAVGSLGTVVPFGLGVLLAPFLDAPAGTDAWPFALFVGTAMSITAFPVLARILTERGLSGTALGSVVMASAALGDVLTWATLALVVGVITSTGAWDLPYVIGATAVFGGVLLIGVRPLLRAHAERTVTSRALAVVMAGLLVSAFLTATIGAHEIFGAFILGIAFPRGAFSAGVRDRVESVVTILLPVFFVTTGLAVDLRSVGWHGLGLSLLVLAVACAGKFVGAGAGARATGVPWRESTALGVMMNTRGLTELIVLSIGRELHVLDDELFTVFVAMALATTIATGPLLSRIKPDPSLGSAAAA